MAERNRTQTKQRFLDGLHNLLVRDGLKAVGINAIAREAKADKALIYRYFGGLDGLFSDYVSQSFIWWRPEDLLAGEDSPTSPEKWLERVIRGQVQFLRTHPETLALLAWEPIERNALVIALERVRKKRTQELAALLRPHFEEHPNADLIDKASTLVSASIHYLAVRGRTIKTFGTLDIKSDQGWTTIEDTLIAMVSSLTAPPRK